jgi:hypothetical protein
LGTEVAEKHGSDLAGRLARLVVDHATPVGGGGVVLFVSCFGSSQEPMIRRFTPICPLPDLPPMRTPLANGEAVKNDFIDEDRHWRL